MTQFASSLTVVQKVKIVDTMEGPYAVHPQQFVGQSPFFYYTPDPNPENRQHGHFTQQPHGLAYPPHTLRSQDPVALYTQRPSSASSQTHYAQMPQYAHQGIMTPVQSPQPLYQKPTILVHPHDEPYLFPLDTECYAPSTPPLSSSGSVVSTPPSSAEILPTPVNGNFMARGIEGMKAGCEDEVFSEILAGENWTNAVSPPMTPGTYFAHSLASIPSCLERMLVVVILWIFKLQFAGLSESFLG